jgi:hypothetical protein
MRENGSFLIDAQYGDYAYMTVSQIEKMLCGSQEMETRKLVPLWLYQCRQTFIGSLRNQLGAC